MLRLDDLHVSYGDIPILRGVSLEVPQGAVVALLGSNGAGKTTTLKTVLGMLPPRRGTVTFKGRDITHKPTHQIVECGLFLVPEWRGTFSTLSVLENLELGAFLPHARSCAQATLQHVFEIFPRLEERQKQRAGTLSGGERQMLAIGRALMAKPEMLILDEPSLGLAPLIVEEIFRVIRRINQEGVTILIVEQNVHLTLQTANFAYILENGEIVNSGPSEEMLDNASIQEAYLGL